jgi:hypothetical protein
MHGLSARAGIRGKSATKNIRTLLFPEVFFGLLARTNRSFLGSDKGGERAASLYSHLCSAKLNSVNPEKHLTHMLEVLVDYPINQIEDLLP